MRFRKYHALGNDYLVLESGTLDPDSVRSICDRHRGLGADGILEPVPAQDADHGLKIHNPDGSEAEKSGNGLRIYAQWLVDTQNADREFTVSLPCGVVRCIVDVDAITVEMGHATFEPAEIPCTESLIQSARTVQNTTLPLTAVGVGNPHCVVFLSDELDTLPWRAWGEALETSSWFPNRTNVQFARVIDAHTVHIRIWERGAGETSASGSSACAVAAAAVKLGHCIDRVAVLAPGGRLDVTVGPDFDLVLKGPVTPVGSMTWQSPRVRD